MHLTLRKKKKQPDFPKGRTIPLNSGLPTHKGFRLYIFTLPFCWHFPKLFCSRPAITFSFPCHPCLWHTEAHEKKVKSYAFSPRAYQEKSLPCGCGGLKTEGNESPPLYWAVCWGLLYWGESSARWRFLSNAVWDDFILPVCFLCISHFSCCVVHWENLLNSGNVSVCMKINGAVLCYNSYPFLLAPSITLSTALLLDLGVSGLSNSEGADRFSVDLLSVACDQKYQESINQHISYTTSPPNIQFPPYHYGFYRFQNVSGETHRPGYSGLSVWSRHCSALPVQSAWTAPPGTTRLSPPSAPCKHNVHQ